MRRYILLLAALMLTTYASAGILPKLQFGLRAGMDYQVNDFKSAIEEIDLKSSTGWFGGAHATLSWGMLGIRPELIYSQNKFDIESLDGSVKMNKVDLPILLQMKLLGLVAVQVGPTFNLMTNTSGSGEGAVWDIKRPSMGYAVGAEVEIWKISISARYNGSFKKSEVFGYTTGENKISTIQLGIGYNF
ncbi:MAG: porin family protein [Alistipes sp.]|nr:porin family protein [Alistipes sp.]